MADPVLEFAVIAKIQERRMKGLLKYGRGLENRDDIADVQFLRHAQEEALDLAIYLEGMIQRLEQSR